jgi:HMG (high mobility group) box
VEQTMAAQLLCKHGKETDHALQTLSDDFGYDVCDVPVDINLIFEAYENDEFWISTGCSPWSIDRPAETQSFPIKENDIYGMDEQLSSSYPPIGLSVDSRLCTSHANRFTPSIVDRAKDEAVGDGKVQQQETNRMAMPELQLPSPALSGKLASPAKPLTAYNYFFRFERERLLMCDFADTGEAPGVFNDYHKWTQDNTLEFQRKVLADQWNRDPTVKRKHCKSHGRISFASLSKHIAASWKKLPDSAKSVFREIAAADYQRYKTEMAQGQEDRDVLT